MTRTNHLHPTAELAPRVLLPGDPGRALRLATALLRKPKMFNHHRGLWGYTGAAADGELLTIQSTGIGGPSAAIVITELAELGVVRLLRVGTCGALSPALGLGDLVIAAEAIAADGTSAALGAGPRVPAGPELTAALQRAAGAHARTGPVLTTDLFYDDNHRGQEDESSCTGALGVEMSSATLFALARRRGLQAGCLLVVSKLLTAEPRDIEAEALETAELQMGRIAIGALSAPGLASDLLGQYRDPGSRY